ncbi:MAG: prepilin-type N-terminal cleavage/methylation domain-containing protein [bacterium]
MTRQHQHGRRGFTLVEVMVTLALLAVAFGVVYQLFLRTQKSFYSERSLLEAQSNARLGLEAVAADIRHASYGKDATQASVTFAGEDSIAFTADVYDSIDGAETITLFLGADLDSGTVNPTDRLLRKVVYDVDGTVVMEGPLSYGIAEDGLAFRYYDRDGDTLVFPILSPDAISEVEVAVTSETPTEIEGAGYQGVTFTTTVFPRNLPFTPSRAKPNPPTSTGVSSPNCESITIGWVTPTQYTDGSTLKFKDISHFNIYYGTTWDDLRLDTRVARIVNEWTVGDLDASTTYMIMVTCVATSDVESEVCLETASPGGAAQPVAPAIIGASTVGSAVTLTWGQINTDVGGGTITSAVAYNVYRATTPSATPIPANRIASEITDTTYVDVLGASCGTFYYRIEAVACGTEGVPTADMLATTPAAPACVANAWAVDGPGFGEVTVGWTPPSFRSDGSPLAVSDIAGFDIVYGTTSGALTDTLWVAGGGTSSGILTSLATCTTYFVNVIAVDDCGNKGNVCAENQKIAWTTTPCDAAIPTMPSYVSTSSGDARIDIVFPTSNDCDIAGYLIYYDKTPGPPFNGVDAIEGASPVAIDFSAAIVDSSISTASLTGLDPCDTYYISVATYDQCTPPNVSPLSIMVSEMPTCIPCIVRNACIAEYANGASNISAHGDIFNGDGADITVEGMSLAWSSGQRLVRVFAGGVEVWDADGSSGGDGAMTPPLSPVEVDVNDWVLSTSATYDSPLHIQLDFNGSSLNDSIAVDLLTGGATCGFVIEPCNLIFSEDFQDDPNGSIPTNWTAQGGSWSISTNRLKTTGTAVAQARPNGLASTANMTVQGSVNMAGTNSNRRGGICTRYVDSNNYYVLRVYPALDEAVFTKKVGGTTTDIAWASGVTTFDSFNHILKITAVGNEFRCWVDGVPITWVTGGSGTTVYDSDIAAGSIGMYSRSTSACYFDNIQVYRTCGGCGP